tara:strand:- start:850 stop:1887 length:1038 start_codon:yes stop_codon:yes gene_type:complete
MTPPLSLCLVGNLSAATAARASDEYEKRAKDILLQYPVVLDLDNSIITTANARIFVTLLELDGPYDQSGQNNMPVTSTTEGMGVKVLRYACSPWFLQHFKVHNLGCAGYDGACLSASGKLGGVKMQAWDKDQNLVRTWSIEPGHACEFFVKPEDETRIGHLTVHDSSGEVIAELHMDEDEDKFVKPAPFLDNASNMAAEIAVAKMENRCDRQLEVLCVDILLRDERKARQCLSKRKRGPNDKSGVVEVFRAEDLARLGLVQLRYVAQDNEADAVEFLPGARGMAGMLRGGDKYRLEIRNLAPETLVLRGMFAVASDVARAMDIVLPEVRKVWSGLVLHYCFEVLC